MGEDAVLDKGFSANLALVTPAANIVRAPRRQKTTSLAKTCCEDT